MPEFLDRAWSGRVVQFRFDNEELTGRLFTEEDGLDKDWVSLFKFRGECCIGNGALSIYRYDTVLNKFVPYPHLRNWRQVLVRA